MNNEKYSPLRSENLFKELTPTDWGQLSYLSPSKLADILEIWVRDLPSSYDHFRVWKRNDDKVMLVWSLPSLRLKAMMGTTFEDTISYLLSRGKTSLASDLSDHLEKLSKRADGIRDIAASAYEQARPDDVDDSEWIAGQAEGFIKSITSYTDSDGNEIVCPSASAWDDLNFVIREETVEIIKIAIGMIRRVRFAYKFAGASVVDDIQFLAHKREKEEEDYGRKLLSEAQEEGTATTETSLRIGPQLGGKFLWTNQTEAEIKGIGFKILETVWNANGRIMQQDSLMEIVWGHDHDVKPGTLATHRSRINDKLRLLPGCPSLGCNDAHIIFEPGTQPPSHYK